MFFLFLICFIFTTLHPMNSNDICTAVMQRDEQSLVNVMPYLSSYFISQGMHYFVRCHREEDLLWLLRLLVKAGYAYINDIQVSLDHVDEQDYCACLNFFIELSVIKTYNSETRKRKESETLPWTVANRYRSRKTQIVDEIRRGDFETFREIMFHDIKFYLPTLHTYLKHAKQYLEWNPDDYERGYIVSFLEAQIRIKRIKNVSPYKKLVVSLKEGDIEALEKFFNEKISYDSEDIEILSIIELLASFDNRWRSFNPCFKIYSTFMTRYTHLEWYEKTFLRAICLGNLLRIINELLYNDFPINISYDDLLQFIYDLFQKTGNDIYVHLTKFLQNNTPELLRTLKTEIATKSLQNFFQKLLLNGPDQSQSYLSLLLPLRDETLSALRTIIERIALVVPSNYSDILSLLSSQESSVTIADSDEMSWDQTERVFEYQGFLETIEGDDIKNVVDDSTPRFLGDFTDSNRITDDSPTNIRRINTTDSQFPGIVLQDYSLVVANALLSA